MKYAAFRGVFHKKERPSAFTLSMKSEGLPAMKPQDKLKFQNTIAKSYKDLLNAVKGK